MVTQNSNFKTRGELKAELREVNVELNTWRNAGFNDFVRKSELLTRKMQLIDAIVNYREVKEDDGFVSLSELKDKAIMSYVPEARLIHSLQTLES